METYDPKQYAITFAGNILTGFDEDRMVTIEQADPTYSFKPNSDGGGTRVRNRNNYYTVRVFLSASSPSNDVLQAIANLDKVANTEVVPMSVVDLNGRTNFLGPESWIQKVPSVELGKELAAREWEIGVADGQLFVGGMGA